MPAAIVMDAPESNHVAFEDMLVKLGAYPVPLFAPIQFPVGKSAASIARKLTAVFAEDDARKVLAPVDVMSDRTPELVADRPRTDNPAEFGMLVRAMLCAGTETVLETVRLLVETLVGEPDFPSSEAVTLCELSRHTVIDCR